MRKDFFAVLTLISIVAFPGAPARAQTDDSNETPIDQRRDEFANMPLPDSLGKVPRVRIPIFIEQWLPWYLAPFGEDSRPGFVHWVEGIDIQADTLRPGTNWRRENGNIGYPLLGFYNSSDREIIRWQLRCAKATGATALAVNLNIEPKEGLKFMREAVFAKMLDVADEEDFPICVIDEVHYAPPVAQQPDVMTRRAVDFLTKYAGHKSYLKIDGEPVYWFSFVGQFRNTVTYTGLREMTAGIDQQFGQKIHWIVMEAPKRTQLYEGPEIQSFITLNDQHAVPGHYRDDSGPPETFEPAQLREFEQDRNKFPDKDFGARIFPGFDDKYAAYGRGTRWLPRHGGRTLVDRMRDCVDDGCTFISIAAWNEWTESSQVEPGFDFDGYTGDPYLYCRIIAAAKGLRFVPPPLPPKESVDPLLWKKLYGIDRNPPVVTAHAEGGALSADVQSGSAITSVSSVDNGDAYWRAEGGGDGITINDAAPATPLEISADKRFTVLVQRSTFKSLNPIWNQPYAAIHFTDTHKGELKLTYPAKPPVIDDASDDPGRYPVACTVELVGDGNNRVVVVPMRALDLEAVSGDSVEMKLSFMPGYAQDEEKDPDAHAMVSGLDIFSGFTGAAEAKPASGQGSHVTYQFPGHEKGIFLVAQDANKNVTGPVAVTP